MMKLLSAGKLALGLSLGATLVFPIPASAADKKPAKKAKPAAKKPMAKKAMKIANQKEGDNYVCVVMGDPIKDVAKAPRSEHKGMTYLFCCKDCKPEFDKDPAKFISKMAKPGTTKAEVKG